jgi:Tol biopolymer transport system component/DNA-binding winged helix-turn-helix (wHTH) protein
MAVPSHVERIAFGPFEMDAASGELLKHGVRLRLSGQPFRILLFLVNHSGEVISQERLKNEIWGDGVFVDFEHGLHAAINKLRQALGDSAENARYIETVPGRGYRFIGVLERASPSTSVVAIAEEEPQPAVSTRRLVWWSAAAVLLIAASASAWRLWDASPPRAPWKLTKLTSDAGRFDSPALSHDGKLIAYSAERSGARDLYIKQVAGGQPIRLTFDGAGNSMPDFSPDAGKIVFHSDRDGGGVYEMLAFGGETRLLARSGRNPKYSPDGTQVAYWIGYPGVAATVPGNGTVWVVPSAGGQPVRAGSGFSTARTPIWSPDGRHLLIVGYNSDKAFETSGIDWWIVPTAGSGAQRTGIRRAFQQAGLGAPGSDYSPVVRQSNLGLPEPACWLPTGNRVIFSARNGDTRNLWETTISAEGKAADTFQRLTAGSGNEITASCASEDLMAFANSETAGNVWSIPFDFDRGKATGAAEQITREPFALREGPSVSSDGRLIAFSSTQAGLLNIWQHDAATGKETQVAASPFVQSYPAINPSGSRVAYESFENGKRILYVTTPGGVPERLCEGCLRPTDWSRDGKTLVTFGGNPYRISLLDVASHQETPILIHPRYSLLYGRLSPDNHWISFTARVAPNRAWIAIARLDSNGAAPRTIAESSWIKISEENAVEDSSVWSPDGNSLYFTSGRDGHICLWRQRLDPNSHWPSGEAVGVQHFHERPMNGLRIWSAAGGRMAVTLMENSGNVWLMSRAGL